MYVTHIDVFTMYSMLAYVIQGGSWIRINRKTSIFRHNSHAVLLPSPRLLLNIEPIILNTDVPVVVWAWAIVTTTGPGWV